MTVWLLFAMLGIPLPQYRPVNSSGASSDRFPCENSSCGCSSAQHCWDRCCCNSDQDKLDWAAKHGVTPPKFLVRRIASAQKQRDVLKDRSRQLSTTTTATSRASGAVSKQSCCSSPKTNSCCSSEKKASKTSCCADRLTPKKEHECDVATGLNLGFKAHKHLTFASALKCHGIQLSTWLFGNALPFFPKPVSAGPQALTIGWMRPHDEAYPSTTPEPASPIPRS